MQIQIWKLLCTSDTCDENRSKRSLRHQRDIFKTSKRGLNGMKKELEHYYEIVLNFSGISSFLETLGGGNKGPCSLVFQKVSFSVSFQGLGYF